MSPEDFTDSLTQSSMRKNNSFLAGLCFFQWPLELRVCSPCFTLSQCFLLAPPGAKKQYSKSCDAVIPKNKQTNKKPTSFLEVILNNYSSPGWCGSVGWAPPNKPKVLWYDSQPGYMPGLQARSTAGGMQEATEVSLPLFLPPFSSL